MNSNNANFDSNFVKYSFMAGNVINQNKCYTWDEYLNFKYKIQGNGEALVKEDNKIDEEIKVWYDENL